MSALAERPISRHRKGCAADLSGLGVTLCANGSQQIRNWCLRCEASSDPYGAKELAAAGINVALLPVVRDYRGESRPLESCVVCTSTESVEYHHFAPQSLQPFFRQSVWNWPVLPLCKVCHDEWHAAVTPELALTRTKLGELGGRQSMTLRELLDVARERITSRLRKSA